MNQFVIESNGILNTQVYGFYHTDYLGYKELGNPDFINKLKNDFNSVSKTELYKSEQKVIGILQEDLPKILSAFGVDSAAVCLVPRAKVKGYYSDEQLRFSSAVSTAVRRIPQLIDGSQWIERHTNTLTTHLRATNVPNNEGKEPYKGITKDTCNIARAVVGRDIILVDDIYTKTVNVDEDVLQALLDAGANSVTLYVIARTKKRFFRLKV